VKEQAGIKSRALKDDLEKKTKEVEKLEKNYMYLKKSIMLI